MKKLLKKVFAGISAVTVLTMSAIGSFTSYALSIYGGGATYDF